MVKWLLHLEGLTIGLLACYFYARIDASWPLFALLFLVPDVSMIGYLVSTRMGAVTYNVVHSYVLAGVVIALGLTAFSVLLPYALILTAHIGFDRFLGFGLKYPEGFKETHLGRV